MAFDPRFQELIRTFHQELEDLLYVHEREADSASLPATSTHNRRQRYQDLGIFQAHGGRKTLPLSLMSKLAQLSDLTKEVSREMDRPREVKSWTAHHPSMPSASWVQDGVEEGKDHQPALVVVLGPPGTEPKKGVSEGRFDRLGSVVYSRTSTEVALPQQHTSSPIKVTKPKDFVPKTEVVEVEKRDEAFQDRPWTRSGTKMLTVMRNVDKKSPYVEDSDSTDLESDEDILLEPLHGKASRVSGRQAAPLVRTAAAEQSSACSEIDVTTDSRVHITTSEDVLDYEMVPECVSEEEERRISVKRVGVEDHLPSRHAPVTVSPETVLATSVGSQKATPTGLPAPSAPHTLSTPSGLMTVFNDLQRTYWGVRGPSGLKLHSKTVRTIAKKRSGKRATKSMKQRVRPCSVRVQRLPRETVQKYVKRDQASQGVPSSSSVMELSSSYEPPSSPPLDPSEMLGHMGCDDPYSPPGADDSDSSLKVVTAIGSSDRQAGGSTSWEGQNTRNKREGESRGVRSGSPTPTPMSPVRVKPSTPTKSSSGSSVRRRLSLSQCWSSDSDFDTQPMETPPQLHATSRVSLPGEPLTPGSAVKAKEQGGSGGGVKKALAGGTLRGAATTNCSVPDVIKCTACGRGIHWKSQQIHEHCRLKVLVCEDCWKRFNMGLFTMENGSENYCTLCGDGGQIICCDYCEKSCCEECIARVSGPQVLRKLLKDTDASWMCYVCSPEPLARNRRMCQRLLEYYQKRRELVRNRLKNMDSGGGSMTSNSELSDSGSGVDGIDGRSQRPAHSSSSSEGGGVGVSGNQGRGGQKEGGRSAAAGKGDGKREGDKKQVKEQQRKSGGGESRPESSTSAGGSGQSGRGGGLLGSDDFESTSSSSAGEESPEVHTDDISMSDSDIFDEDTHFRKKKRKKRSNLSADEEETSSSSISKNKSGAGGDVSNSESSVAGPSDSSNLRGLKKPAVKRQSRVRQQELQWSDSSSDFEIPTSSQKVQKKQLLSPSSDEETEKSSSGRRKGKSKLAQAVSSGSESEVEAMGKQLSVSVENRNDDHSSGEEFAWNASGSTPSKPVRYVTANGILDSSDSDVGRRRKGKKRVRLSRVSDDSDKSSANGSGGKPSKKRAKDRRAKEHSDDDDFAAAQDLTLVGPRLKQRRQKRAIFSSSDSGSEGDNEEEEKEMKSENEDETPTKGQKRKKLRKLITDSKLAVSTREAQSREKQRIERLEKLRKQMGGKKEDVDRLVLEMDPETKEVRVEVRRSLLPRMKPHQRQGTKFLYEACVERLEQLKAGEQGGAILAHCMGLGKTLQVISFVDALLNHEDSGVSRVLVLSPINTIHNWKKEFDMWIPYNTDYDLYLLMVNTVAQRIQKLKRWFEGGGVLFAGYEMFRNLVVGKRLRGKSRDLLREYLLDPGPDIVVCDEGHVMRNSKSSLTLAVNQVRTRCRIVLTGTPLQNNLLEYYTMVNFVKPNLLGTIREFTNRFVNPIKNGQCRDSTPADVRMMKRMAHVLHSLLDGMVQRRDYRVLAECLPPKQEYVLSIKLSPVQDKLYRRFLEKKSGKHTASDLFSTFSNLSKVWNHPWVLKMSEARRAEREQLLDETDDETLGGFIVSEGSDLEEEKKSRNRSKKGARRKSSVESSRSSSVASSQPPSRRDSRNPTPISNDAVIVIGSSSGSSDEGASEWKPLELVDASCVKVEPGVTTNAMATSGSGNTHESAPKSRASSRTPTPPPWFQDILTDDCEGQLEMSGKLCFLLELLNEAEKLSEKVLVFSQSLLTLDIIEEFLGKEEYGDWTPGLDYYRLDGSTKPDMRAWQMQEFNEVANNRLRLFLISTRAGSLGVNLVAANRVVIFDACWNPSHDLQAIFRTYRFGQTKPIFVYRLLAGGTMEEKIYDRQVTKQSLSLRVVDEMQIERHYTASDLAELFTYSPTPPPAPPYERPQADLVLANILNKLQPQWITGYHEHNSLLEHIFDEELPEEERKAAWETYKAQMAAESIHYNYSALQTRLDEEGAAQLQQGPSSTLSVGMIVNILTMAVQQTKQLQALFMRDQFLRAKLSQERNPVLANQLVSNKRELDTRHSSVFGIIKQVNELLSKWQLGRVTLHPDVHQKVESLRVQLLTELSTFKSMASQPAMNAQGMVNVLPQRANVQPNIGQTAAMKNAASTQHHPGQQVLVRAPFNQQMRPGQSSALWQSSQPQVSRGQMPYNPHLGQPH